MDSLDSFQLTYLLPNRRILSHRETFIPELLCSPPFISHLLPSIFKFPFLLPKRSKLTYILCGITYNILQKISDNISKRKNLRTFLILQ